MRSHQMLSTLKTTRKAHLHGLVGTETLCPARLNSRFIAQDQQI